MKKLFFIAACFCFLSASAQTVEEIIQKYATNMGGLDNFNKVKTAKITATFNAGGMDLPMNIQIINNHAARTDLEASGNTVIRSYKDGKGWTQNSFAGINTPKEVSGQELNDYKVQSSLASPLMDYKARGHQVELLGQETVEGIKSWKIKLTNKDDGKLTYYFISAADNTLIESTSEREMRGQTVNIEVWYSDLKEFNGLKFYMTKSSKIDGQVFQTTTFDKVELNVPVDEKIFDLPK